MKLNYRKLGAGQPFIILHGLFGLSDNWQTIGKQLSEQFEVFLVDLRNHGLSPHSEEWNYKVMSEDVYELIHDNNLNHVILMGHSMGGKTAMQFSSVYEELLDKLIVVDIAPKKYAETQEDVVKALTSVDLNIVSSRKQVEDKLEERIKDFGTRQFLLKNLFWKDEKLAWKFNLDVIARELNNVAEGFDANNKSIEIPTLFIRGDRSNYITKEDESEIKSIYPQAEIVTVPNAGHWVHAENPKGFLEEVLAFVNVT